MPRATGGFPLYSGPSGGPLAGPPPASGRGQAVLRARQKLGKYRIERRLSDGPLAAVYQAYDTIHGLRVALKIPHRRLMDDYFLADFRKEVRVLAKLDHPNILPIQNACFIDGLFVISMPLGEDTLGARLQRRISTAKALDFSHQILSAVAHAHEHRIIHCDIKPDNFILFPDNRLRLTDFGFSKLARKRRIEASGSGTVGYVAPEQAMGRPVLASDVFSVGLVLFRLFSGMLPRWPYDWPPPGTARLRQKLHPDMVGLIRRAIEVKPTRRYRNGIQMLAAFERIRRHAARRR
jgi:eukaryotic-like serine/threonine-protein kinase